MTLRGQVFSNADAKLRYRLAVERRNNGNRASMQQSGQLIIKSGETLATSTMSTNFEKGDQWNIILTVYDEANNQLDQVICKSLDKCR
ncbi:hypothetical protein SIN8267_02813 [Sinobacterium norvegicum]|uniref:Curli assembly protein CsgC n=2 Tax=Sinobacterium norvegicum TaxID=1641715 RepID=A0ABN8ELS6_9GAMM|nr:hypothetical protein SIN8267_02813 [Sinobacterium norvegicum]